MSYKTASAAWWAGIKALLPIVPGVAPFGLITGVTAVKMGLSPELSLGMTGLFYAGSSQLAALQLLNDQAALPVILLTALVINMRFVMYSASLAPYLGPLPWFWKWPLCYLLTDHAYALSILKYRNNAMGDYGHYFVAAVSTCMWLVWMSTAVIGIVLGAQIPASWALDFAIPLMFLALLIPVIQDSPSLAAALVAGTVAVCAYSLPYNSGLMLAAISGICSGIWLESRQQRRAQAATDLATRDLGAGT
jgi:4-azaleucine resistance transporter AzlC